MLLTAQKRMPATAQLAQGSAGCQSHPGRLSGRGQVGAQDGQQHPQAEQVRKRRQPAGHGVGERGVPLHHGRPVGEAAKGEDRQPPQFHPELVVGLATPASHEGRPERQRQVEAHLHAERPGLADPGHDVRGGVDLSESQVNGERAPTTPDIVRVQDVGDDEECRPVGGDDPPEPAGPEGLEGRGRPLPKCATTKGRYSRNPEITKKTLTPISNRLV